MGENYEAIVSMRPSLCILATLMLRLFSLACLTVIPLLQRMSIQSALNRSEISPGFEAFASGDEKITTGLLSTHNILSSHRVAVEYSDMLEACKNWVNY